MHRLETAKCETGHGYTLHMTVRAYVDMYIGALTSKLSSKQTSKPNEGTNKGTLILKKLHATEDLVQQKHRECAEW